MATGSRRLDINQIVMPHAQMGLIPVAIRADKPLCRLLSLERLLLRGLNFLPEHLQLHLETFALFIVVVRLLRVDGEVIAV